MEYVEPVTVKHNITFPCVYPMAIVVPFVSRNKPFGEGVFYDKEYNGKP